MSADRQSNPSLAEQLLPALTDTQPPLLAAAGTSTEESKRIWESIGRLRTSEQTDVAGKAATEL